MPGRYASSRATKFLYLDGARMTGADGPLTKSESETELPNREVHRRKDRRVPWSFNRDYRMKRS